jgi:hypothetical protein
MRASYMFVCVMALGAVACMTPLASAKADFRATRYGDARVALVGLEAETVSWSPAQQASYALYRGLTHGALGDPAAAEPWLRRAKKAYDQDPEVFPPDDRVRLKLALEAMDAPP